MTKILVVDDDTSTRTLISRSLEKDGFQVIRSSDGARALDILNDNSDISLLITDMMMPNMSGRELVENIRKSESISNLPIIIISGVVKLSDIVDILERGATRFIPKPVNTQELKEYVHALIAKQPSELACSSDLPN